jgi:hypothetical protein
MESATTNLSEVTADFVRLWDGGAHREVREMFVNKQAVVAPQAVEVQVGQETDTELVYPTPTDEQIPGLKGLLAYIDGRGTGGPVTKNYTVKRKHYTVNEGAVQQVQQHKTLHTHTHEQLCTIEHHSYQKTIKTVKRTNLTVLEVFAPVLLVKQVRNVRVTRPIYIFAS